MRILGIGVPFPPMSLTRRRAERSWPSAALATVLTFGAGIAVLDATRLPSWNVRHAAPAVEQITYVAPRQVPVEPILPRSERAAPVSALPTRPEPAAQAPRDIPPLAMPVPASIPPSSHDSGAISFVVPSPSRSSTNSATTLAPSSAPQLAGPRLRASIRGQTSSSSAAIRDSVLTAFSRSVPRLARERVPTQTERDERAREVAHANQRAREEHRPVRSSDFAGAAAQMGGFSISIPIPWLSAGPSRAERTRDSLIMLENARILKHLQARADSARLARESRDSAPPNPVNIHPRIRILKPRQ